MMMQQIIQALQQAGLYPTMPIKDLPQSCCPHGHTVVVDFDQVKDKFCKDEGIKPTPKSADALNIQLNVDRPIITFVEMKAIDVEAIKDDLNAVSAEGYTTAFSEQMKFIFKTRFEVDKKVVDSILLFLDIIAKKTNNSDYLAYLIQDCQWQFGFALGCSSRDFVRERLSFLSSRYHYHKVGTIDLLPHVNIDAYLA